MAKANATYGRTAIEKGLYRTSMQLGERIFKKNGLQVVTALGVEAVAAVGFAWGPGVSRTYIVSRDDRGLYVSRHNVRSSSAADCSKNDCLTVRFFEQITEGETFGDSKYNLRDITTRLTVQKESHDALEAVYKNGAHGDHNPFGTQSAAAELQVIGEHHGADPLLAKIIAELP